MAEESGRKATKAKRKRDVDSQEDNKEAVSSSSSSKATKPKQKPLTLPQGIVTLFEGLYSEEHDMELSADMIKSVSPYGDDGSLFTFQFSFPGEETLYNSFCLKHKDAWFITPKLVLAEECDFAILKMKQHLEKVWDVEQMGIDSIASWELKVDHVLFDFEKDQQGLVDTYPLVFRFQNDLSDHGLWCGINFSTGQSAAYTFQ